MAGVAEPAAAGVVDEHHRYRPGEPLRRYVAWYTGYRQRGVPPARHRGLPSPYLTLIFTLDEPLTVEAHPDPGQPPGEFGSLLGGLHSAPALITHEGAQSGIQLALKPLGARALLGLPAGELADLDVPAEAVLGRRVRRAAGPRAVAAPGWPERFAIVDEMLLRADDRAGRHGAGRGGARTRGRLGLGAAAGLSGGTVRIADLAAQTGWSGRYLAARFRTEIGLTPKAAARVVRFSRARCSAARERRGRGPRAPAWPAWPPACGYFDQAHLAREFRSLAGCPPSQWIAEEFETSKPPPPWPREPEGRTGNRPG